MFHRCTLLLAVCLLSYLSSMSSLSPARADDGSGLNWIWTKESQVNGKFPPGKRWFRKVITIDRPIANPVDEAKVEITADDAFTVWFNGHKLGDGTSWKRIYHFDAKQFAAHGNNVIAVEAENTRESAAGLLVRITVTPNGKSSMAYGTDGSWKTSSSIPTASWNTISFDDSKWETAHVLGGYGATRPWGKIDWQNAPTSSRFTVPEGFVVDTIIPPQPKTTGLDSRLPFSLINMTFDDRGRLLVSQERGPVLLCTNPDSTGAMQSIKPYCKQVKNAQGLCWVKGALLVVGDGPQGTGLYRAKDTKGADETDEVKLLHKFKGGMGEHGPHAIIHGPDDWLYLVIGNHAWAQPKSLAQNSPLKRWPTGHFGPDQGMPNTTEDVLLPRLNDGRGHAANILAPGGTIWRLDHDGNNMSLVAAGFRNHFDAAFNSQGELFTFDSDMEWDEGMPWYRAVRVCHCPPGADFVWRTGAANTPNYYLDSLPPMVETGRGSPCGVTVYEHNQYPQKYAGSLMLADWSIGVIWAVHLQPNGATFSGQAEKFCVGAPLNVTDLEVGPDGSLYFTLGGRGTAGGVYRIRYVAGSNNGSPTSDTLQPLAAWSKARGKWKEHPPAPEQCLEHLKSGDPLKIRRACENIIRYNQDVNVDVVWPILHHPDQYARTAARLVLQRIEPSKWIGKLKTSTDLEALEAIVALCKIHQFQKHQDDALGRLSQIRHSTDSQAQLQLLRAWQLACIHGSFDGKLPSVQIAIKQWFEQFPASDDRVNRELAILLVHASRQGWTELPVAAKLVSEMIRSTTDRKQQIYYFYTLRLLHQAWPSSMKNAVITWFEQTKSWTGGHSFAPFMENMFLDWCHCLNGQDRSQILENITQQPYTASMLLRSKETQLSATQLIKMLGDIVKSKDAAASSVRDMIIENLGRQLQQQEVQQALRQFADRHPELIDTAVRALARNPSIENAPYYLAALQSSSPLVLRDSINALTRSKYKPKPDDAVAFRNLILATAKLAERDRMLPIKLLQQWKDQRYSPNGTDFQLELAGWSRWFGQQFPKATPIPNVATLTASSKWKLEELRKFLENDPKGKTGDVLRGKAVFTKANCIKCHKFGSEGEGLGPDLTTLKGRFQRLDTLEALLDPSKTISDQYRGTVIVNTNGQTITGLAAPQGDSVTVLQTDGTKVTLKKADIDSQVTSTVSAMPEKLLDELTLQEIADLFAYLESTPK